MVASESSGAWQPSPLLRLSAALHAGAIVGLVYYPERWAVAGALLVADHLTLVGAGLWPRAALLGENMTKLPEGGGAVALTFDDGPDPEVTPGVLDRLDEAGARATFFCVGRRAERYPDLVREIARRGHGVENHTFRHSHLFAFYSPGALGREIDRAQECLAELSGRRPRYFRAPAGIRSPWLDPVLARRGLRLVSWTRRGFDAVDSNAERVGERLERDLGEGDILLLHDGRLVGSEKPLVTLDVLPRLLDTLAERGLLSVALPRGEAPA